MECRQARGQERRPDGRWRQRRHLHRLMPRALNELIAFNRGLVSRLALARVDLKRMAFSAEVMENWMPRALGSMMLRPGLEYIGQTLNNSASRFLAFVFSTTDVAMIELTPLVMRVWIDEEVLSRAAVSSAVTNGTFDANIVGWTDASDVGGSIVWVAGGYLGLTGSGSAYARARQQVSVAVADQNVEHGLKITVRRGPVVLRVGSTAGGDEYITETTLNTGHHSLAFTPTGAFWIEFSNSLARQVLVSSCDIVTGDVELTTPWDTSDLGNVRAGYDLSQSADVLFVACDGFQQRRIERRGERSWSIVVSQSNDGPFRGENVGPITITPSGLNGNITLTASVALFTEAQAPDDNNDGSLYRLTSQGQEFSASIAAQNTFTTPIRVTGVDATRVFSFTIDEDAAGAATFTLQRSLDSEDGPWTDVLQRTADTTETYDDGLDNQIAWYRLGVKTGDYVNGTHTVVINYTVGSVDGVVRITAYTSPTLVSAEVLSPIGGTAATDVWAEGSWSNRRGWPTSIAFYEGRLASAGRNGIQLSVSDAFESHDEETEGDSGPINRTIGSGPVDTVNWLLPMQRLLLGAQGAEFSVRSTAFDEPLTPSNFNIKDASSQGSASVQARKIDSRGVFVQRGGTRLFELAFNPELYDYTSTDLTQLIPEIGRPQIVRVDVQRQPDTRIHAIRSDGKVAVLVWDKVENVLCWLLVGTYGAIEDYCVLPGVDGDEEDRVYCVVRRTINGATVRYLEKWATEAQCVGGTLNRQADAFVTFTNSPASATVSGLTHLVGESVVVWADGKCMRDSNDEIATFTVSASGTIELTNAGSAYSASTGIVGLPYEATYKTAKLGRNLGLHGRIDHLHLILADTHHRGLRFGPSLDDEDLEPLPLRKDEAVVDEDTVFESYDQEFQPLPTEWSTDPRVCFKAMAPRPCTILGAVALGEAYG
jgi:hypothetical protein